MEKKLLGFIGTGNMGGALARAAAASVAPGEILLANRTMEKAAALAAELGCGYATAAEVAAHCKYVFLGVKPHLMAGLMKEIVPALHQRTDRFILVSMAAGLTMERIQQLANGDYPVVRICPNTPVTVGKGLTTWCADGVTPEETDELLGMMGASGQWFPCDESIIDAASVVGGCTPAFVYMFIEALADGGVRCGLPRRDAILYAAKAVEGAAALAATMEKHPGQLKDEVCSPRGSTIVGVSELEAGAFRSSVMDAVYAAWQRNLEMGK